MGTVERSKHKAYFLAKVKTLITFLVKKEDIKKYLNVYKLDGVAMLITALHRLVNFKNN